MIMTNYRMITGRLMWVGCGPAWKRGKKMEGLVGAKTSHSPYTKNTHKNKQSPNHMVRKLTVSSSRNIKISNPHCLEPMF